MILINKKIICDDLIADMDMNMYFMSNARGIDGTPCQAYIDVCLVKSVQDVQSWTDLTNSKLEI